MTNLLSAIHEYGQSIWLDNLTRDLIRSGELKQMVESPQQIWGITSNPAIFQKAIAQNAMYDADIEAGVRAGLSVQQIYESLIFEDIRNACDILMPVYETSKALDGYVSIEVPPTLAQDGEATLQEARRYHQAIGRPNVMIKIPGTLSGFSAIEQAIQEGINVNITLLFSVENYLQAAQAYIRGLESRVNAGQDISNVASVASFFISRIDNKVDAVIDEKLKNIDSKSSEEQAQLSELKGKVAIANAKIAYQNYKTIVNSSTWEALAAKNARVQRLLWASTSPKNPSYSDVMYVDALIGPQTVATLPPATLSACADHCNVPENRIETGVEDAYQVFERLKDSNIDIDLAEIMEDVLSEGIELFVQPFNALLASLSDKMQMLQD